VDRRSPKAADGLRRVQHGGYRIIKQRLKLFHSTERLIGMDFVNPPIDFAALARSLGVRAHRIDIGDEFGATYRDALAAREPVFLEVSPR
jgi:benzoylformate decarboxylase